MALQKSKRVQKQMTLEEFEKDFKKFCTDLKIGDPLIVLRKFDRDDTHPEWGVRWNRDGEMDYTEMNMGFVSKIDYGTFDICLQFLKEDDEQGASLTSVKDAWWYPHTVLRKVL